MEKEGRGGEDEMRKMWGGREGGKKKEEEGRERGRKERKGRWSGREEMKEKKKKGGEKEEEGKGRERGRKERRKGRWEGRKFHVVCYPQTASVLLPSRADVVRCAGNGCGGGSRGSSAVSVLGSQ